MDSEAINQIRKQYLDFNYGQQKKGSIRTVIARL